jgi:hypothetical protein
VNYKLIDVDVPWVFIPLAHDDAMGIHLWQKRWYSSPEDDEALAADCEKAIKTAFDTLGLQYNTEAFGDVKMENLRLYGGSDGISLPETAFVIVPPGIKKIKNPLRPLQEE